MTFTDDFPEGLAIPNPAQLAELHRIAVDVAEEVGCLIHAGRPSDLASTSGTKTTATDPVTVMDMAAEALLRHRLATLRPDDGLLGEEGSVVASRTGLTWVVDPIDGTTNYLYDLPLYAVSVAVVVGDPSVAGAWRPVVGAVRCPPLGVTWSALLGGGATRSWVPTVGDAGGASEGETVSSARVGGTEVIATALIGTGFAYDSRRRAQQAEALTRVMPAVRDIRRMGSAAIDLCLVGDGRLDGFFEVGLHPWDVAAGWLIVSEAGGIVTGVGGGAPTSQLVVAANPVLHPQLHALVAGSASVT